jgi:F-type H+-transporting ATPase subunit a
MQESELWITRLFNDYLPGVGNFFLGLVKMPAEPRPWADFVVMQILVVFLLALIFAILRPRLSVDRPGGLQHIFELIYDFVHGQAEDQVGHDGAKYTGYFFTIFIFILVSNLIGLIPCFESPTNFAYVTCGCAMATFLYYHGVGIKALGFKYPLQFMGPMIALAPLMVPIEIVSHLARPLSLTVRLYANMFAGEQVTLVFLGMTKFIVPVIFMGLHIFVGVVQAYIFMLLTMVYVGGAVSHEH